ncbi:MAG: hypothetical protein A2275_04910 [Bacteroidetes bacterium RIFOXYA12_FULL_35_11]|nr:MAG: hypothetical protein A2X01_10465 [Bacteroidetes bacterium GWF2_35_48]OFY78235.1 MAG: hypothetical protein A2275_04910 [Bacteroidetes bacterium RIFOXYA12_FULL_35_11]OFY92219.1 MAG: hypothetical protein A2309_06125 [Bacteroidetes bacterium RIFOXYB2_FULL_35_7]OFY95193.1 MAG: hypothetical protein A2491_18815 [Bacteroidetes bacterium RIFOXYC12_FULL_35_7]HBX49928.1 NUDIX hydrolase [Bacteroidales bacterium]
MYKIYFNERKIILTEEDISSSTLQIYEFINKKNLHQQINKFISENKPNDITIYSPDTDNLFKEFSSFFKIINAAGGVVFNQKEEFLGIKRLGRWDLPKGKAEKGESPEITAIREVSEECGIKEKHIKITCELSPTYHTYYEKGSLKLKKTHWFKMCYTGITSPYPQLEEDIVETRWIKKKDADFFLKNTYTSLHDVIIESFS